MKIHATRTRREEGVILIVVLCTCAVIGITLAAFMTMTSQHNVTVARSQTWNSSMILSEAGIEDALSLINKRAGRFTTIDGSSRLERWTNSTGGDNWDTLSYWPTYIYTTHRTIGNDYYDVYITNIGTTPTILSVGTVNWSGQYASAPQSHAYVATIGNVSTVTTRTNVSRKVLVTASRTGLFDVAMAAIQTIDFKGNNINTDSFDSSNPLYSTNGLYPAGKSSMIRSNGDVCSDLTIISSISVGNANIHGKARTGPNGTVAFGPNGYATGGTYNDFNVTFPDVVLPTASWVPGSSGNYSYGGNSYKYLFTSSGDYTVAGHLEADERVGSDADAAGEACDGTNALVRLKVTSDVKLTGNSDQIRVCPGANLEMYINTPDISIGGQGVVNDNNKAANCYIYGLTNSTSISIAGNATMTYALYAPQAAYTLGGGGATVYDFMGASVSKTVVMNGHFKFHYDEALRITGPGRGYVLTNWKES